MPFSSRDALLNRTKDQKKGSVVKVTFFAAITFIAVTSLALSRIPIRDFVRAQKLRTSIHDKGHGKRMDQAFRKQVIDILEEDRYAATLTNDLVGDLKDAVLRNEMFVEHYAIARILKVADDTCRNEPSEHVGACFAISVADDVKEFYSVKEASAKF